MKSKINTELESVFCNREIYNILNDDAKVFPLWYGCMNYYMNNIKSPKFANAVRNDIFSHENIVYILKTSMSYIARAFSKKHQDNIDVLFLSRDRFVDVNSVHHTIKSDYLFFSIISGIATKYPNIKMNLLCSTNPPEAMCIKSTNIQSYLYPLDILGILFFTLKKTIQWKLISRNLSNELKSKGSIKPLTFQIFNSFFTVPNLAYYYLTNYYYYNAFKKLNPRIIVSNDDVMQLKPKIENPNLQFITLQSANVLPIYEAYLKSFIQKFGSESIKSDYFICIGEYFKKLKEYSNVSKKVVVMGQPRYDILAHADKIYDKNRIVSDLGLDPNKKILLWCTQTHDLSLNENISNINAVYNTMTQLKEETQLIIKLHPGEDQEAPNYYNNTSYRPMILKNDVDTYSLLFVCDLLITKSSTTAIEAVILNKPVVILNLSREPNQVNYVREGVALGVYNPVDLLSAIEKLIEGSSTLHENRNNYINKYLYKIDGKATDRIVNLIKSMLDKS